MIPIAPDEGDADAFIAQVSSIVGGISIRHAPSEVVLIKIDNWFGPRWLRFSGKTLGALGIWKQTLTVPPFVPNRVVWQQRFLAPSYDQASTAPMIHVAASSEAALSRRVSLVAPGAALIWFSGNTAVNGRGAVMAYVPAPDSYWVWFAGFARNGEWLVRDLKEITAAELSDLVNASPSEGAA